MFTIQKSILYDSRFKNEEAPFQIFMCAGVLETHQSQPGTRCMITALQLQLLIMCSCTLNKHSIILHWIHQCMYIQTHVYTHLQEWELKVEILLETHKHTYIQLPRWYVTDNLYTQENSPWIKHPVHYGYNS